jgi:hypothetical protein
LDIHVYWNILTMHGPINVKSPNNTSKWQMGFNSAFKGLSICVFIYLYNFEYVRWRIGVDIFYCHSNKTPN